MRNLGIKQVFGTWLQVCKEKYFSSIFVLLYQKAKKAKKAKPNYFFKLKILLEINYSSLTTVYTCSHCMGDK